MGRPKGELRIAGSLILDYLLDRFAWDGPTLLVTAPGREHPPGWRRFGREVVDPVPDQGPLRGILTALENLQTPLLLVATVDMPGIQRVQFDWLIANLASDKIGLLLKRGDQVEPFPCILRSDAITPIAAQLKSGIASVMKLERFDQFDCFAAPRSWDESVWINLNYPSDLHEWT